MRRLTAALDSAFVTTNNLYRQTRSLSLNRDPWLSKATCFGSLEEGNLVTLLQVRRLFGIGRKFAVTNPITGEDTNAKPGDVFQIFRYEQDGGDMILVGRIPAGKLRRGQK